MSDSGGALVLYVIVAAAMWFAITHLTHDEEWRGLLAAVGSVAAIFVVARLRS